MSRKKVLAFISLVGIPATSMLAFAPKVFAILALLNRAMNHAGTGTSQNLR